MERYVDLAELRIFRAVVKEGGVTRAAERLHRVQSNVTTRIRQLEEKLGTELFIREGKRLRLTPSGQVLLGFADRLLALADEAGAAVLDPRPRGTFRLGAMESTAAVRLPEPLSRFHRLYPDVALELRVNNPEVLTRAMLAGELDAALVAEPVADTQFDQMTAFTEELVIVSAADRKMVEPSPSCVLVFEHGCPYRKRLDHWCARRGFTPERVIELGSYHAMLGCVVAGMGIALLPESVLPTVPETRRLKIHRLPRGENRSATLLIWRKGTASANVAALRDVLAMRRLKAHSSEARPRT
jgi:DNA-binding transcriptional LysR family regulator